MQTHPNIERHTRIQPQCLIHHPLQIRHALQILIRWHSPLPHRFQYLSSQPLQNPPIPRQFLKRKTQRSSSRIPPRKQHSNNLIPNNLPLPRPSCSQRMQETLSRLLLQIRRIQRQRGINKWLHKLINNPQPPPKLPLWQNLLKRPRPRHLILHLLHFRKRSREFRIRIPQTIHTLPQQIIRRAIKREPVKQRRNIHLAPLRRYQRHQFRNVVFENLQIRHPRLHKLRPQQLPTRMPQFPIRRENAIPQKPLPLLMKGFSLPIIRKLRRQHGFDILRVRRKYKPLPREVCFDGFGVRMWGVAEEVGPEFVVGVVA